MKRYPASIVISLLALLAGGSFGCSSLLDDSPGQFEVVETVLSPSRTSTAYLWTDMGGGAAGWCYKRVSILPDSRELPLSTEPEKNRIAFVFSSRCSSKIKVTWIDDTLMKISHSLGDDPFPTSLSQASRTEDGRIRIVYEIIEK